MPFSIRLSGETEQDIRRWVREGRYESKADAVRQALSLLRRVEEARRRGYRILAIPAGKADKLQPVLEIE